MVRVINRLSAQKVERQKSKAFLSDGGGLYLRCEGEHSKTWIFRYTTNGKTHDMSLGSVRDFSLAVARTRAAECRRLRADGIDPLSHRNAQRAAQRVSEAKLVTFPTAAERFIAANRSGWRNVKHADQWEATLETYAYPVLRTDMPIQAVDTSLVLKVLEPIWSAIPETANRVRGRIEAIIDAAKARGEYQGENPARWKGHLATLLPKRSKIRKKQNHPALPFARMPEFMSDLRACEGIATAALEFQILTASRPGNVLHLKWSEIERVPAIWLIAGDHMKNEQDHKVPLSRAALDVLDRMEKLRSGDYVFFGAKSGRPLSDAAQSALIDRMNTHNLSGGKEKWIDPKSGRVIVPHGFRSTFRTWGSEKTSFAREVLEKALAHTVGDETERAYDRGDLFDKRRKLMDAWARFATSDPAKSADVLRFDAGHFGQRA